MSSNLTVEQAEMLSFWNYEDINPFISLNLYTITTVIHFKLSMIENVGNLTPICQFFLTIVAYTMPVPSGTLIPIFRTGAAFGRMIGEAMFYMFPNGINVGSSLIPIVPGLEDIIHPIKINIYYDYAVNATLHRRLRHRWSRCFGIRSNSCHLGLCGSL